VQAHHHCDDAKIDLVGVVVPAVRHDEVREELLSGLTETGRRQYEALGAVYEARQLTAQLAGLRSAANLSQRQAALRAGVDQADVSRIESGQITPSLPTLLRL
jgi:DNA-binding XRE family transcriptional regulator